MLAALGLLHRYASPAWKHRWVALVVAWVLCLAGWVVVARIPSQFEATARVYVDTDAVLTPLLHGLAVQDSVINQVDMLQRTLLSRPNLEKLVARTELGLDSTNPVARAGLLARLAREIRVQSQARNLFTISYRNPNPRTAYHVVQTLLSIFLESATGYSRQDLQNAQAFLDRQIVSYERKLRRAEQQRAAFRAKYIDVLPDANGISRLISARTNVTALQGSLEDATDKRNMLQHELKTTPPTIAEDNSGPTRLEQARRKLEELRQHYTDAFPGVIEARRVLANLEHSAANTSAPEATKNQTIHGPVIPNPVYEALKVRLLDAEAEVESLTRQVAAAVKERNRLEAIAHSEPGLQAEYQSIDRDYSVLRSNYEQLIARREASRITEAANTQADKLKFDIVDPPVVPHVPVAPKRDLMMLGVLVIGLGGGVGAAVLLGQLDRSFYGVEDLNEFGLPVLGGVSVANPVTGLRLYPGLMTVCAGVLLLVVVCGGLLARGALRQLI